ncbi:MAG: aminoglycoside phosphotransferase family protein [Opitutae bacterium]|nr:aminoglycoside phosphotransferase family protein [Opitutae bacterium]
MSHAHDLSSSDLAAVAQAFLLHGHFISGAPYGSGHINDTYAVIFDQAGTRVRYILQRINHNVFRDVPALMENIARVTSHAAKRLAAEAHPDASRRALTLVPTRDGRPYHRDAAERWWRCYLFVEKGRTYDIIERPSQAAEAARAFGAFQHLLVDLPGARLHETIPGFHHTRQRFERLRQAATADAHGRAAAAKDDIAFAFQRENMVDQLLDLQARGELPERITHNDTKLNNVILDDATQAAVCVIDLDTVMPGLAPYDFGDMMRTATNSAAEDETDLSKVQMRLPIFEALVTGYLESAGAFLNATERASLVFGGMLMTYEVGIRFLTDYLAGDVYFKIKRPHHNLDRARNQFALLRQMEQHRPAMEAFVRQARP